MRFVLQKELPLHILSEDIRRSLFHNPKNNKKMKNNNVQTHVNASQKGKEKKMMVTYLDPKADLTFKKVFGEHKRLVKSLLNALLPLSEEERITGVTYMNPELIPEAPWRKNTIVDVCCTDRRNRKFLVEMQLHWNPEFKKRVLLNAAKAYVRQSKQGEGYKLLQPVYSLNLVNDVFETDTEEYYHHYKLVNIKNTDKVIDGLQLVFVELPKFKPDGRAEKKMYDLWLRYLTEVGEETRKVPAELTASKEVEEAVKQLRVSAFNDAQLAAYEKFWDAISVERTFIESAETRYQTGLEEGIQQGIKQGIQQGIEQGRAEERQEIVSRLKAIGVSEEDLQRVL